MTKPNVAANAAGLPKAPAAPFGPLSCAIDIPALRRMSMVELSGFREALYILRQVANGLNCQPKFSIGDTAFNGAGEALDRLTEFLSSYEQAVVNVTEVAEPTSAQEVENRAWTLLGFDADLTDSLARLAVRAAEAVRDVGDAKFRERHEAGLPQ